jgi:hypothetical protein
MNREMEGTRGELVKEIHKLRRYNAKLMHENATLKERVAGSFKRLSPSVVRSPTSNLQNPSHPKSRPPPPPVPDTVIRSANLSPVRLFKVS